MVTSVFCRRFFFLARTACSCIARVSAMVGRRSVGRSFGMGFSCFSFFLIIPHFEVPVKSPEKFKESFTFWKLRER